MPRVRRGLVHGAVGLHEVDKIAPVARIESAPEPKSHVARIQRPDTGKEQTRVLVFEGTP
jgi:hypothetical protein